MSAVLLTNFHNLEGNNINECKKNFFKLLKTIPSNVNDIDSTLNQLLPQNYLEECFMIDILIYFHRTEKLFEILKSGNDVFISKIVKQPWFFEELFKLSHNNCSELVNNVIPNFSYPTRIKVLKKICKVLPEGEVDCLYDAVLERYGLGTAKVYLPFCSVAKIENVLKERYVPLKSNHLIQLFRKSPDLLDVYIEEHQKHNKSSFSDATLLQTVAEENLTFFCKLKEKYKLYTKLGRRVTKKLIDYKRNDVVENKHDYASILRADRLARRLKSDFKVFYFNIHTRNINDKYFEVKYVKHFPKKYQFFLIQSTFQRIFKSDIASNLDWVDTKLLQMIRTELDQRHKLAELKYNSTNEMDYVQFMDSKTALKLIKEKINLTSNIGNRTQLLKQMLDMAKNAENMDVLEEVLKYYLERHRNEEPSNKDSFVTHLYYKEFDYEKFNENHWKYLMQILTLLKIQEWYGYPNLLMDVAAPYLDYLYKNNKFWKDELSRIIEDLSIKEYCYRAPIPFKIKSPEVKRLAILNGIARMKSRFETEDFVRFTGETLTEIDKFNKDHPEHAINFLEEDIIFDVIKASFSDKYIGWTYNTLIEAVSNVVLEKIFNKDDRNSKEDELVKSAYNDGFKGKLKPLASLALELANKKGKTKEEQKLNSLLWKNRQTDMYPHEVQDFILKYIPKLIVKYSSYFEDQYPAFSLVYVKYYKHIFGELIMTRLEKLIKEKQFSDAKGFVRVYANVCPESKYRELAEKYVPEYEKVDLLDNPEQKDLYGFQCAVAENTKYYPNVDMLSTCLKYCKGDFQPSCLAPLHKTFYHLPENLLADNLKLLDKKAVALRKHYPALACKLLDSKTALEVLKQVAKYEQNTSCKKHLIVNAFNLFSQNPTQGLFDFITNHLSFMDKNDEESLNALIDIQKVDVRFRASYVTEILKLLCHFEKEKTPTDISSYKNNLLKNLGENEMKDLSDDVCRKDIIEKYFLKPEYKSMSIFVGKFVEKYLKFKALNSTNETECFDFIYSIIRNQWKSKSRICREMIDNYFKNFHKDTLEMDVNTRYVALQIKYFLTIFNPIEFFEQYLRIRLLEIKNNFMESNGKEHMFLEYYAKKIRNFSEEIFAEFGLSVLVKVAIAIRESVPSVFQQLIQFYTFCYNILSDDSQNVETNAYLIVILLLDWYSTPRTVEEKLLCDKIFQILRNNDTKIVQIHLNILLSGQHKFEYMKNE